MTTLDKFIGRTALFFIFFSLAWLVESLTEPAINIYKVAFWFVSLALNTINYLNYKWLGN